MIRQLPNIEPEDLSTFSPYDINKVDAELVNKGDMDTRIKASTAAQRARILTGIVISLMALATIFVLVFFCIYTKKRRETEMMTAALSKNNTSCSIYS